MAIVKRKKQAAKKPVKERKGRALTREITGNLVAWFRFTKQFKCVATEVGWNWKSDVLALSKDRLVEIEVKISASDLRNDKKKMLKHHAFQHITDGRFGRYPIPTQFYYCVPKKLEKVAIDFAKELNPSYGVIVFDPIINIAEKKRALGKYAGQNLSIVKPAKALHSNTSRFDEIRDMMVDRLSSALAIVRCSKEWLG